MRFRKLKLKVKWVDFDLNAKSSSTDSTPRPLAHIESEKLHFQLRVPKKGTFEKIDV